METLEQYLARRDTVDSPLAELVRAPARCGHSGQPGAAHTPREILQQPWVWRETVRAVAERREELGRFLDGVTHVVLTGAGSSAYAGESLVPVFRARGFEASAVPTTDLVLSRAGVFPANASGSLLVSLARSGDSPESAGTVDRVLRDCPQVRHLILCCNKDGALARKYGGLRNVCTVVLPESTNDRSLVMTSSFTSLIVAGQSIAGGCAVDLLAQAAEPLLDRAALARQVAGAGPERVCLLAARARFGGAREGALKLLESTAGRVAGLAETFLGLRHGPLAFLNDKTAVIFFFSADPDSRRYELDVAAEVRAKKLGMVSVALGYPEAPADLHLPVPVAVPDFCRPPLDVLFPQMLALFLSLRLGLQPDSPSESGVIHRVVQGVVLY